MNYGLSPGFWKNVDRRGPDECWEWQGKKRAGVGVYRHLGRWRVVHRELYSRVYGRPRHLKKVHRVCGNPLCVNPKHMSVKEPEGVHCY